MSKSVTLSSLICCCEYSGYSQKYLRKITGFCSHFGIRVSARGGLATSKGDRNTMCEESSKWISNKYLQNFICWNSFTLNGNFWNWKCGKLWLSVAKAVVEGEKKKKAYLHKLTSVNSFYWFYQSYVWANFSHWFCCGFKTAWLSPPSVWTGPIF